MEEDKRVFREGNTFHDVRIFSVGVPNLGPEQNLEIICNETGLKYIQYLEKQLGLLHVDHPVTTVDAHCEQIKGNCGSLEKAHEEICLLRNTLENMIDVIEENVKEMIQKDEKFVNGINELIKESRLFNDN